MDGAALTGGGEDAKELEGFEDLTRGLIERAQGGFVGALTRRGCRARQGKPGGGPLEEEAAPAVDFDDGGGVVQLARACAVIRATVRS